MMIINNNENTMMDTLDKVEYFEIINNGESKNIYTDSKEFDKIKKQLQSIFAKAHLMPAFGVSIHELTIKELEKDCWLKIHYNQQLEKNGLPFTSLLIKLEDTYGTNLIREYENKYDGRCIYLDFAEKINLADILA